MNMNLNLKMIREIYSYSRQDILNVVRDDMEEMMTYKKGSSQYKTETLKTADNIRLFQ
jgi:hypothetical protein